MRILLVAVLASALAACGVQESVGNADAEIDRFHQQLDAAQFDAIWAGTGAIFRKTTPKHKSDRLFAAVHKKLGNVRKSERAGWKVNATTDGTFVVVNQVTEFDKGPGTETFTFLRDGDDLQMVGYNINSEEMMLN